MRSELARTQLSTAAYASAPLNKASLRLRRLHLNGKEFRSAHRGAGDLYFTLTETCHGCLNCLSRLREQPQPET